MKYASFCPLLLGVAYSPIALAAPVRVQDSPTVVTAVSGRDLEQLSASRDLSKILQGMPCPNQTIPTIVRGIAPTDGQDSRSLEGSLSCVRPSDLRMIDVYNEHNRVRAAFGSQPLVWDLDLANGAAAYAMQMPRVGLQHSPRTMRPSDVRENLQHGLRGSSGYDLTRTWISESRFFVPGTFPNVSSNGDWTAVAHFTQMVWPTTTRLGCGSYVSGRDDWFVCRYSGPGNRDGTKIAPNRTTLIADNTTPGGGTATPPPTDAKKPPPPPTSRDEAPNGKESGHPLVTYWLDAKSEFWDAVRDGDRSAQAKALDKAKYALSELKKRWKAAKAAGGFSKIDPAKVKAQVDLVQQDVDYMEHRYNHPEERG